jgi:hypothetical protein
MRAARRVMTVGAARRLWLTGSVWAVTRAYAVRPDGRGVMIGTVPGRATRLGTAGAACCTPTMGCLPFRQ